MHCERFRSETFFLFFFLGRNDFRMRSGFVRAYKIVIWKNKPLLVVCALCVVLSYFVWSFSLLCATRR